MEINGTNNKRWYRKSIHNVTTLTGLHFHYNYKTLYTEKEEKDLLNKLKEQ